MRAGLQERLRIRVASAQRKTLPLWAYASAASVLVAVFSYWFAFLPHQKADMQKPSVAIKQENSSSAAKQAPATIQRDKSLGSVVPAPAAPKASVPVSSIPANQPKQSLQVLPKSEIALAPSVHTDAEAREEAADIALADSFLAETETTQVYSEPAKALAAPGSVQAVGKSMERKARKKQESADTQYLVTSKPVSARKEIHTIIVPADTLAAAPAEGWLSYRAYLEKNTDSAATAGQIVVTFSVSSSGALSDFKAKGPENLQMEAIRIISNGPAWAPARANGTPVISRAEIQLQFRRSQ
jgi:hypothetical protein